MKILKNVVTIVVEVAIFFLGLIWYLRTKEEEPLIVMIGSGGFLIASVLTKIFDKTEKPRPKIVFHRKKNISGRGPLGYYTANNPRVIRVGIDKVEQYWYLDWTYTLEIRNNSSVTAYSNIIEYENKPANTELEGEIGKIQPIKPDDKFEFTFKLTQNVVGNHLDADKYLEENADILLKDMKIISKYQDEFGKSFKTEYDWINDNNKFN